MLTERSPSAPPPLVLTAALLLAQLIVGGVFILSGWTKLTTPIVQLSAMMAWTGELPSWFVRGIGLIDLAGGLGLLLPSILGIRPGTVVWAAAGAAVLQICAIVFHVARGEGALTPLNFGLLILAVFVFWGRRLNAIASRRAR